jgi:hypothetical protein
MLGEGPVAGSVDPAPDGVVPTAAASPLSRASGERGQRSEGAGEGITQPWLRDIR